MSDDETRKAEDAKNALRSIREDVVSSHPPTMPLPPLVSEPVSPPAPPPSRREPPARPQPTAMPPDLTALDAVARLTAGAKGGGILKGLMADVLEAQGRFNAEQMRVDTQLIQYLHERIAATHAHYDQVLSAHQSRMDDIDERHRMLQEDVVKHVHDLVRRIDLGLSEGRNGRATLDFLLRDLKKELQALQDRVRGE